MVDEMFGRAPMRAMPGISSPGRSREEEALALIGEGHRLAFLVAGGGRPGLEIDRVQARLERAHRKIEAPLVEDLAVRLGHQDVGERGAVDADRQLVAGGEVRRIGGIRVEQHAAVIGGEQVRGQLEADGLTIETAPERLRFHAQIREGHRFAARDAVTVLVRDCPQPRPRTLGGRFLRTEREGVEG